MQHHFDESFGYLGAPIDMSNANPDGGSYWGRYAKKTLVGSLTTCALRLDLAASNKPCP